jgi:protein-disulfide isomerase
MTKVTTLLAATGLALFPLASSAFAQTPAAKFDEGQTKAIQDIVKDYLLKNPEILLDMQQAYELKAEKARAAAMEKKLPAFYKALAGMKDELAPFTIGKGDVTIVEFFDYNCGFCRRAFPDLVGLMNKDKGVRTLFLEFPVLSPDSTAVSHMAIAAAKQGKYFEFHRAVMAGGPAKEATAMQIAEKIGLDMTKLKADMASPETNQLIAKLSQLAKDLYVDGTPTFIIGDKLFPGAAEPEQLKKMVADVRSAGCAACVKDEKKS